MNRTLFTICVAVLVACASSAFEIGLYSGEIPLPNQNGDFTEQSTQGHSVYHAYFTLTPEKYAAYTNSATEAADIYADYLSDDSDLTLIDEFVTESGKSWISYLSEYISRADWWDWDDDAYFAGLFVYVDEINNTNYIARAVSIHTPLESEDENPLGLVGEGMLIRIDRIAVDAGRWEVIYNEPPSITCTDLCVTGGVVSATYSISEFSRLNEIVSGEETSVIVAADLARTTQTNLAASVTATNSVDSTFTFSFNPAEQNWTNSTLFILGVEPPR